MTSTVLKWCKKTLVGLMICMTLWFMYSFTKKLFSSKDRAQAPVSFDAKDSVQFKPEFGKVIDVSSDMTVDALLQGTFGPVVVMFYADWCTHCKNMADAYENAAKLSTIPFVRVDGGKVPISSRTYSITGYPTILGVANVPGKPRHYAGLRTTEGLLEFSQGLCGRAGASGAASAGAGPTAVTAASVGPVNTTHFVKPVVPYQQVPVLPQVVPQPEVPISAVPFHPTIPAVPASVPTLVPLVPLADA